MSEEPDGKRRPTGVAPRPAVVDEANDDLKLQLLAEELSVAKATSETGRVRVATHTREREALIDENLVREHAEIETVPIGRRVFVMPETRQEGDTTIIPVIEEVLYTERRLMLKEEIRIRLARTTERHQERVTLRHQEAVVTRNQNSADQTDAVSVTDDKLPKS